jgi:hypothetical protein
MFRYKTGSILYLPCPKFGEFGGGGLKFPPNLGKIALNSLDTNLTIPESSLFRN